MNVSLVVGDVFEHTGDVLICPANPWLNMSGGVNGEILLRCGPAIQKELHNHLVSLNTKQVVPTTVVVTSPGTLNYKHLIHAVAIDVFYDSDPNIVTNTLVAAWKAASKLGTTAVMPAIATGYGRLPFEKFGESFCQATVVADSLDIKLLLVVRSEDQLLLVRKSLSKTSQL